MTLEILLNAANRGQTEQSMDNNTMQLPLTYFNHDVYATFKLIYAGQSGSNTRCQY
jgi:hypothetical protein